MLFLDYLEIIKIYQKDLLLFCPFLVLDDIREQFFSKFDHFDLLSFHSIHNISFIDIGASRLVSSCGRRRYP